MNQKYAIQNNSGQWWTGTCWGVEQAREEYARTELPDQIGGLDLIIIGDVIDYVYENSDGFIVAAVLPIN